MTTDHLQDIMVAAASELDELARLFTQDSEEERPLDVWALEVVVFRADGERYRVEFLTGVGGPTTRWVVDSRWSGVAEFHHSWGTRDGVPCDRVDVHYPGVELLEALAEDLVEMGL